jgi:23S rRNA (guanosine2251-2'-O)-methyltransferase
MGQRPRAKSDRTHRHTDLSVAVAGKSEDDLFAIIRELSEPPFLLILDEIQDPHNLGACLRSADAAGVHAVIVPKDRAVGLTDVVRRTACGGAEQVPFVKVTNLARTLKQLKDADIWVVGTTDQATQTIYELDLTGPLALVMGAEGKGMRRLTADYCDFLGRIPRAGTVECLNVSVAAGVCLFEAVRQRTSAKTKK